MVSQLFIIFGYLKSYPSSQWIIKLHIYMIDIPNYFFVILE